MQIPGKPSGRPKKRNETAEWLRRYLSAGRQTINAIRRASRGRGDSWGTVKRCKKELQIESTIVDGTWWWSLPGLIPQGDTAEEAGDREPDADTVSQTEEELMIKAMHGEADACRSAKMSVTEIEDDLRKQSKAFQTSLSDESIETLIRTIARKYAPAVPVWDVPDPAAAIAKIKDVDLPGVYTELRNEIFHELSPPRGRSTDAERLKRLQYTLDLLVAERTKRK